MVLEIPPPHHKFARNKLLFLVYFSENEPTSSIFYHHVCQQIKDLINEIYLFIIRQNKI